MSLLTCNRCGSPVPSCAMTKNWFIRCDDEKEKLMNKDERDIFTIIDDCRRKVAASQDLKNAVEKIIKVSSVETLEGLLAAVNGILYDKWLHKDREAE